MSSLTHDSGSTYWRSLDELARTPEFEAAVREIVDTIQPEFIVVEATGVAESDALVYEVQDNLPEVRLDCVVFVVDAYMSLKFPYVSHTMDTQLKAADVILINKIDQMTTDEVQTVESQIRQYNENAVFFKTMGCDMDTKLLFGLAPSLCMHCRTFIIQLGLLSLWNGVIAWLNWPTGIRASGGRIAYAPKCGACSSFRGKTISRRSRSRRTACWHSSGPFTEKSERRGS